MTPNLCPQLASDCATMHLSRLLSDHPGRKTGCLREEAGGFAYLPPRDLPLS